MKKAKKKTNLMLGMDCGGTNIKMALVDPSGKMAHSALEAIDYKQEPKKVIKNMAERLKSFMQRSGNPKVAGIGIGIAGDVDSNAGIVRFSPNLGWTDVPLKKWLSPEFKMPILVENDANCAALGAFWLDARKGCRNLVCLTLGTGVGGGLILNGKLYRGSTGSAGEMGHMSIQYDGRACKCGSYGCSESLVGAWGLIQTAEEGLKNKEAPVLQKILEDGSQKLSPKLIAQAANEGDPFCKELWEDAGEQLGCILTNCVNIFNPDQIVLSGGVSKVGALLMDPALNTLGQRAFKTPLQKVKVTVSKFDEKLGVMGAALLFSE